MRWPLFLLLQAALITACGETPPLAPDRESDLARGGGGRPSTGNITIVDLGFTNALDINEQGHIVGYQQSSTGTRGVLWTPLSPRGTSGSITDLSNLGGNETYAFGLNEEGQITGGSSTGGPAHHAFIWDAGILALQEPAQAVGSFADDVTSGSGTRYVPGRIDFTNVSRAAVWSLGGSGVEPALLPGVRSDDAGQAFAANAAGTVVGDALGSTGLNVPARWTVSGSSWSAPDELPLLLGTTYGQAFDVNVSGVAVGFNGQHNSTACARGVVWVGGSTTPLQDLAGGTCSIAWAINDRGHITGEARDARGRNQAVLWIPQPEGGYSILALGRLKATLYGQGRGLNEPQVDASEVLVVEVVGASGSRATLWKVKLP